MAHRVIQWSTGNVGLFALRAAIRHPELEVVGLVVHSESKEGQDAGTLCGLDPDATEGAIERAHAGRS